MDLKSGSWYSNWPDEIVCRGVATFKVIRNYQMGIPNWPNVPIRSQPLAVSLRVSGLSWSIYHDDDDVSLTALFIHDRGVLRKPAESGKINILVVRARPHDIVFNQFSRSVLGSQFATETVDRALWSYQRLRRSLWAATPTRGSRNQFWRSTIWMRDWIRGTVSKIDSKVTDMYVIEWCNLNNSWYKDHRHTNELIAVSLRLPPLVYKKFPTITCVSDQTLDCRRRDVAQHFSCFARKILLCIPPDEKKNAVWVLGYSCSLMEYRWRNFRQPRRRTEVRTSHDGSGQWSQYRFHIRQQFWTTQ